MIWALFVSICFLVIKTLSLPRSSAPAGTTRPRASRVYSMSFSFSNLSLPVDREPAAILEEEQLRRRAAHEAAVGSA